MKHRQVLRRKHRRTKSVLHLLDLEHAKSAVLNSLTSSDAQSGYRHVIDEFVELVLLGATLGIHQDRRSSLPFSSKGEKD